MGADHAVMLWDGPGCSFASTWPLPIKPIWKAPGDPPIESDDRVTRAIEAQLCGATPAYRAVGKILGRDALLCVAHAAHVRACPECAPLLARLTTAVA